MIILKLTCYFVVLAWAIFTWRLNGAIIRDWESDQDFMATLINELDEL